MTTLQFTDTHNLVTFLAKPDKSEGFEQVVDFLNAHTIKYALTINPIIYTSCIKQFWATVKVKTVNEEQQLQALVDGKKIVNLQEWGMRNFLRSLHSISLSVKTTAWNEFSSTMASAIICLAKNQKFNFSMYIFESMMKNLDNAGKFLMYPRRPKEKDTQVTQPSVPSDPTNVADEAVNEEPSMQLKELMDFCTKLQQRVLDQENTKTVQAQKITSLKKRVKKLEKKGGSRTHKLKRLYKVGRSARVVSSDKASLGDQEDASKQGRKIHNIDADEDIILENVHDAEMFDVNDLDGDEVVVESEVTDKDGENRHIVEEAVVVTDAITILVSAAIIANVELTLA
ncbi:hypothetical protein Tco_1017312 [Tanacetum coccineum]|uniref:Xylulose kinase-1 n=1 Tax=Tanacetum coccineum TaxID=301880 RepID=A0ABQ5FT44_9ASTR